MKSIKMKVTIATRDTSIDIPMITFRRIAASVGGKEIAIVYYQVGCMFKKGAIKLLKKRIRKSLAQGGDDNG